MATRFGAWLRHELTRRDMRQADLAQRLGTSTGAVSDWINGKRHPNPASVEKIADVLFLDVDDVLAIAGHRPASPREDVDRFLADLRPYVTMLDAYDRTAVLTLASRLAEAARTRADRDSARAGSGASASGT